MKINQIVSGDCIQVMIKFPNNSIDLLITDPPYGDNVAYGTTNKSILNNENPLINCLALVECYRLLKKNKSMYIFTNWKHYPFLTEFIIRYTKFKIRHLIVWKKYNFGLGWAFRHQYELILVLEKGKAKYNLKDFSDVQTAKAILHNNKSHPHQKPIDLITKIIEHSSKEGDLILDPFCGSGAICKAAQLNNRKFIGIELDEKWVGMARNIVSLEPKIL
ncbi:MAG: site-specific DNA-methyltransferase [Candidatus Nanoarchaeia archaeon]|nr:site-specific DNA-methyltransferase [Candidatus Nanoarchaeia archaeon]